MVILANELTAERIRKECDANFMRCETTEKLLPLKEIVGQERAVRALKFGLGIRDRGFNIYVAGYPGTGRTTAVKNFVGEIALTEPVPPDWCYVNNFSNQYEPKAIKLSSGKGKIFKKEVKDLVDNLRTALPKAFESEDYNIKRETTIRALENQRKELMGQLNTKAQQEGFVIQSTPIGLLLIPVIKGKPVSEEEMVALTQETKDEIQQTIPVVPDDAVKCGSVALEDHPEKFFVGGRGHSFLNCAARSGFIHSWPFRLATF